MFDAPGRRSLVGRVACVAFIILTGGSTHADERWSTARLVEMAKTATTDRTIGYLYADLAKAPLRSLREPLYALDAVVPRLTHAEALLEVMYESAQFDRAARAFGVREALVVVDFEEHGYEHYRYFLRLDRPLDVEYVEDTLLMEYVHSARLEGNVLHVWRKDPERMTPAAVDEVVLSEALETFKDRPWRAIYLPSQTIRQELSALAPPGRDAARRLVGEGIARDLRWAAAGYDPSGQGRLALHAVATDEPAATRLRDDWRETSASLQAAAVQAELFERASLDPAIGEELRKLLTPTVEGSTLKLTIDGSDAPTEALLTKLLEGVDRGMAPTYEEETLENMHWMTLGMRMYHEFQRRFPPSEKQPPRKFAGREFGRGLSWRVELLPYVEQAALYDRFKHDEPWDSEHNKALIAEIPDIFKSRDPNVPAGMTTYMLPQIEGSPAAKTEPATLADYKDDPADTILILDAAPEQAAIWTKPGDLAVDLDKFAELVGQKNAKRFVAGFADGTARSLPRSLDKETVRRLLHASDGEAIAAPAAAPESSAPQPAP